MKPEAGPSYVPPFVRKEIASEKKWSRRWKYFYTLVAIASLPVACYTLQTPAVQNFLLSLK